MTAIEPVRESRTKAAEDTLLIDTDVHENWRSAMSDLEPFMDPFRREQMDRYFSKPVLGSHYLAEVERPMLARRLDHDSSSHKTTGAARVRLEARNGTCFPAPRPGLQVGEEKRQPQRLPRKVYAHTHEAG
jgi:hypothetical protein